MPADTVLIGYYGRGNLGDDLLMIVAASVAQQVLPQGRVAVRTSSYTPYVARLLGKDVEQLPFGTREHHRLIIHGGGGNFFDFTRHSAMERMRNGILLAAGTGTAVRMDSAVRALTGRRRISADVRIGLGLGIGTYSRGSPALLDALPVLADFDALWVRDASSIANLASLGVSPVVVQGSDLAFLWDSWCPPELALSSRKRGKRARLGLILRDWPPGSGPELAAELAEAVRELGQRFDLTLISFDQSTDTGTLQRLNALDTLAWSPNHVPLAQFLVALASQDVLLTARAHGAICGACLGRPSVILEIEPKLRAIHRLLPGATRLAAPPFDTNSLEALIDEALAIEPSTVAADAMHNRTASERALEDVLERAGL